MNPKDKYVFFSCDLNAKMKREFFEAIKNRNQRIIFEMYKSKDANVAEFNDPEGFSGLFKLIKQESYDIAFQVIEILKKKFSDLDFIKHLNACTPSGSNLIHEAAVNGSIEMIQFLIDNGTDLHAVTNAGLTATHIACQEDHLPLVIYLVERLGLDSNLTDKRNSLPLHWASYFSSVNCVKYLITKCDNLNAADIDGNTFLHLAAVSRSVKVMKILVYAGVSIFTKNKSDRNALELCIFKGFKEEEQYLRQVSSNWGLCSVNPSKENGKSRMNIYLFFILHLVFELLMYLLILPHYDSYKPTFIATSTIAILMGVYISLLVIDPMSQEDLKYLKVDLLNLINRNKPLNNICFKCCIRSESLDQKYYMTTHCIICDQCVLEFNHHCFWANKCIGKRNLFIFYTFLLALAINLIVLIIFSYILLNSPGINSPPLYQLFNVPFQDSPEIINAVCAIVFGFSILFLCPVLFLIGMHAWNEISSLFDTPIIKYSYAEDIDNLELKEKLISN